MKKIIAALLFLLLGQANANAAPAPAVTTLTGTNTVTLPSAVYPRQLIDVHCAYTASATVGNRIIVLELVNGSSTVIFDFHTSAAITAGQADYHIDFIPGTYRETAFDTAHSIQTPFAAGLIIPAGYTVNVLDSANISASDSETVSFETIQ